MIIHSREKHVSLQILHWTRNDVGIMVQDSFTRYVRTITTVTYQPSKHMTCIVMDGTCMYNCPTLFFLEMFR